MSTFPPIQLSFLWHSSRLQVVAVTAVQISFLPLRCSISSSSRGILMHSQTPEQINDACSRYFSGCLNLKCIRCSNTIKHLTECGFWVKRAGLSDFMHKPNKTDHLLCWFPFLYLFSVPVQGHRGLQPIREPGYTGPAITGLMDSSTAARSHLNRHWTSFFGLWDKI